MIVRRAFFVRMCNLTHRFAEMIESGTLSREELREKLNQLVLEIRTELQTADYMRRRSKRCKLQNFSPWLVDGYDGQVEVPGQYTGDMKPLPHTHLTIAGFGTHVSHIIHNSYF